jgi:autotransporter-associated beta strand protein
MKFRQCASAARGVLAVCGGLWLSGPAVAATNIWDGDGPSGSWATNANWQGDTPFAVSNDVVFYAVGTNLATTLNGNRVIASLLFNNDADSNVFISGNTLYVNDGITVDQDAAGQHYISSQINLSNSQAWAIDSTNGGTLMVGAVRQNGNRVLTKTGGGTLLLTNSALQASNFVIQSGIVRYVGSANGFNDNDTAVQVDAGAVLDKDNIWGTEAFRALRGAGVVTNWVGELQLRPSNNEYQLFTGAIIQGNSNANLRLVHDGNNSTIVFDRSTNAVQAFDAAVPFNGLINIDNGVLAFVGENGSYTNSTARHEIGSFGRATRLTTLLLDSSVSNHVNNDRIHDDASWLLSVGSQIKIVGNDYTNTTETLGNITNAEGRAIITIDAGSGGSTVLTAKQFTNINLARSALVRGDNLGAADGPGVGQFQLLAAPVLSHAGSGDQVGIVPYMVGDTNADGWGAGLVTYDPVTGVRLLTAAEYTNAFAADRNVRLSANDSIAGNTSIRALHMEGDGTTADLGGNNLRVDSQAIFVGGHSTLQGGTITFGTNTTGTTPVGYIHAVSNLTLNSSIVNNGGGAPATVVTFDGPGTIYVGATQAYTGNTYVFGGATIAPTASEVLSDLSFFALDEGNLILGDGITETIGSLRGSGASYIEMGSNSTLRLLQNSSQSYYGMMNAITNSTLWKTGNGTLSLRNTMTNFQANVVIDRGTLELIDVNGRLPLVPRFSVTNATLELDNQPGGDNANQNDRIGQEADVILNSGTIILRGSRNANTSENIGDLVFQSGFNTVQIDADSQMNNNTYLNPNTFSRSNAATALIRAEFLGETYSAVTNGFSRLAKDNARPAPTLTHSIAGSNTPSVGIVHWAYGQDDIIAAGTVQSNLGLVTYDDAGTTDNGFRLLRESEYNRGTFDLGGNVWITNGANATGGTVTLVSNTVVQGLVYQKMSTNSATTRLQLGGNVLTVESGAVLSMGNTSGSGHEIRRTGTGGLTFGNANNGYEAVFHTTRRLDVYAPIYDNIDALGNTNSVTLIKSGTSELVMRADGGGASTYSGDTYVNAGTLRMEGTNASSYTTASVIPKTTFLHINNRDATFDLYNSGQIVGGLDGWGRVLGSGSTNTGGAANPSETYYNALVVNYTNTSVTDTFDGWIQDGGGAGGARRFLDVVKQGDGVLEFTTVGRTNLYRGDTIVEGGTLLMNGTHISLSNTTDYIVRNGGTLGGTGLVRIGGTFTFEDGATLAPGNSPGTFTMDGDATFGSNAVLAFELNGADTTVGGGINDLVVGIDDLYLDGILDITALGSFAGATTNDFWTLMTYDGSLLTNLLDISAGSQSLLSGGQLFAIDDSFAGEIRLTVIPEPQTWALVAVGLGAVAWLRRRRR